MPFYELLRVTLRVLLLSRPLISMLKFSFNYWRMMSDSILNRARLFKCSRISVCSKSVLFRFKILRSIFHCCISWPLKQHTSTGLYPCLDCSIASDIDARKITRRTRNDCFSECGPLNFGGPVRLNSLNTPKISLWTVGLRGTLAIAYSWRRPCGLKSRSGY